MDVATKLWLIIATIVQRPLDFCLFFEVSLVQRHRGANLEHNYCQSNSKQCRLILTCLNVQCYKFSLKMLQDGSRWCGCCYSYSNYKYVRSYGSISI